MFQFNALSQKKKIGLVLLLPILVLLIGCTGNASNQPQSVEATQLVPSPTSTPLPESTSTPEPATLYIEAPIPVDIVDTDQLNEIILSDSPESTFWFGHADAVPEGELLFSSAWVYVMAAPFPTLRDEITLEDFRAYWIGEVNDTMSPVTQIYVPEAFAQVMSNQWGDPLLTTITIYQELPLIDLLWDNNAWIVLPFDQLNTKLKVISVDGVSPLIKDYRPDSDPLAHTYNLIGQQNEHSADYALHVEELVDMITSTNRDEEKLTTLVMTGVTALVRATAYRMEQHGVLYPGEKIVHWLAEADLTHISNEVSFYEDCPFPDPRQESLFFCSDPKYIELLDFVGADIIELTGNHNNDMLYARGIDVVPFTLDLYDQYGMVYYGGGRNLADSQTPLLITHNGNRFAFIGCNAFGPDFAWATESQGGAAPCDDFQWMVSEVSRLKSDGALPIATYQYYEDYYNFAVDHHIRDYGLMAEAGAVIVNGSQAHRPKAMAFEQDSFIDYGLGNLFFDQKWYVDYAGNVIVQTAWVGIQRHTFYDNQHLSIELLTAKLEDFAQPRPMTETERQVFLDELFTASGWNSR